MLLRDVLLILFIQNLGTSVYFIMIFINVISHIHHYVHAETTKTRTISFLNVKIMITPDNARNNMFNKLFALDLVTIDTNLLLCGDVHLPLQTTVI